MSNLHRADYERDVVYLFQFPRSNCSANMSPYCLKLETWLRMADVKYENESNKFTKYSKKGQVPFVELNGKEIDDSNMIISQLIEIFHKEHMNPQNEEQKWQAIAIDRLLEGSLVWTVICHRAGDPKTRTLETVKGSMPSLMQKLLPVMAYKFKSVLTKKTHEQGYGRHSEEERLLIVKDDLTALSLFLGNKKYMFGDQPSTLDACVFGHLCQWWFIPDEPAARSFLGQNCANLVTYLQRIKTDYWPDWEKATGQLSLDSNWKVQVVEEVNGKAAAMQDAGS